MNRILLFMAACAVAAQPLAAQTLATQTNQSPALTFEPSQIVASNFTPGAPVIAISIAFVGKGYSSTTSVKVMGGVDSDHDGTVLLPHPNPVPLRSIWIAIDRRNADFAVASPRGYQPPQGKPPVFHKHNAAVDEIEWESHAAYLVYAHPGGGIWTGFAGDGAMEPGVRRDGTNRTSFLLSSLQPLLDDNDKKPDEIKPGGTLFLVDAYDLHTTVVKVDGAMLGGAN